MPPLFCPPPCITRSAPACRQTPLGPLSGIGPRGTPPALNHPRLWLGSPDPLPGIISGVHIFHHIPCPGSPPRRHKPDYMLCKQYLHALRLTIYLLLPLKPAKYFKFTNFFISFLLYLLLQLNCPALNPLQPPFQSSFSNPNPSYPNPIPPLKEV